ncbi:MAG: hypothetical protein IJN92_00305 [Lachnospiraceae bacterium]|nr:hypothetical protein [Lachnospiraceae bacterium]
MIYLIVLVVLATLVGVVHTRVLRDREHDISAGMAKKHFEELGMDIEQKKWDS